MSTVPSSQTNYLFETDTELSPATFNGVFGSIADRLGAQEGLALDYQSAIDQLSTLGLQVISETLAPSLNAARDQVDELQALTSSVTEEVQILLDTGIAAENVIVADVAGLEASTAQDAFSEIIAIVKSAVSKTNRITARSYYLGSM